MLLKYEKCHKNDVTELEQTIIKINMKFIEQKWIPNLVLNQHMGYKMMDLITNFRLKTYFYIYLATCFWPHVKLEGGNLIFALF